MSMQVAITILEQMGGIRRISAMIGAKQFTGFPDGVQFKFPNPKSTLGNCVKITLDPSDTYIMEFWKIRGTTCDLVKKFTDVYCDQLIEFFEQQTKLYLHF